MSVQHDTGHGRSDTTEASAVDNGERIEELWTTTPSNREEECVNQKLTRPLLSISS